MKFLLSRSSIENETTGKNRILVAPEDVEFLSGYDHKVGEQVLSFAGGNWDKPLRKFADTAANTKHQQVINACKSDRQTEFYKLLIDKLNNGQSVWCCATETEFVELLTLLKSGNHKEALSFLEARNEQLEIKVDIGRSGSFLLADGAEDLALAKLLNVEKIPATVLTRHTKWARFRKRFQLLTTNVTGMSYQPPLHPDLEYIQTKQSSVERLKIIEENLSENRGRLLDLGANIGYFTINMEMKGFDCVAVENYPPFVYCLRGQKKALNKQFRIITDSILDSHEITREPYDVVLALNILFHFLYTKESFERMIAFLERLRCREFFFEPHLYTDPQLKNAYINFQEIEFVEFVKNKLGLANSQLIGTASDNRHIYKIS